MVNSNGDVRNHNGIANYSKNWHEDAAQDLKDRTEDRLKRYTDVVNGYYDGATEL